MTKPEDKTILVVDDELPVRRFLQMALEDAGFHVMTAADGFEALELMKGKVPDLISLDLVMPKHSGVKLFRDLQKNRKWSHIPVLIVTGHARDDLGRADYEEMMMSGPGIYLEKPVKPESYVNAVKKLLKMDAEEEASARGNVDDMRLRLKSLIDSADEEAVKKAMRVLKGLQ